MQNIHASRGSRQTATNACTAFALIALAAPGHAAAQAWQPERNVELIVPSAAGGGLDRTARALHAILHERKLVTASITVVNKPGGSGTISYHYLSQFAGDGHYISISSPTLLTNHILAKSKLHHSDFTPLAQLSSEYLMLSVKADSPLRNARDVIDALKKDPGALSIAIGSVIGGSNHIGVGVVLKAAGVDIRKLKTVVFKSGGESVIALLGGHVHIAAGAPEQALPHIRAGKMRVVGIGAPQRLSGELADVPTWKEQGYDVIADTWRGIVGPRNLTAAQVAYWDGAWAKLAQSSEWKKEAAKHLWVDTYRTSAESRRFLDQEYADLKAVLLDLGLAR